MTEEKLNALFQEMNQEVIETVPNDLLNWKHMDANKKSMHNKFKIVLLIVTLLVIVGILIFSASIGSSAMKEQIQPKVNFKQQENTFGTKNIDTNGHPKNSYRTPVSTMVLSFDVKTGQQLIMKQDSSSEFKIGQLAFRKLTGNHSAIIDEAIKKSSLSPFSLFNPFQPKNGAIMDSTLRSEERRVGKE